MREIRELSAEEIAWLHGEHMKADFPPAELKTLEALLMLRQRGVQKLFGWFDGEDLYAYASFVQPEPKKPYGADSYILLDYYAVCRGFRGEGVGSEFLNRLLQETDCAGVLFEVEDPEAAEDAADREIRERRIRFYERLGCRRIEGIRVRLFGVDYLLLLWTKGECLSAVSMKDAMERIYRGILPPAIYEANVQFYLEEVRE